MVKCWRISVKLLSENFGTSPRDNISAAIMTRTPHDQVSVFRDTWFRMKCILHLFILIVRRKPSPVARICRNSNRSQSLTVFPDRWGAYPSSNRSKGAVSPGDWQQATSNDHQCVLEGRWILSAAKPMDQSTPTTPACFVKFITLCKW